MIVVVLIDLVTFVGWFAGCLVVVSRLGTLIIVGGWWLYLMLLPGCLFVWLVFGCFVGCVVNCGCGVGVVCCLCGRLVCAVIVLLCYCYCGRDSGWLWRDGVVVALRDLLVWVLFGWVGLFGCLCLMVWFGV